MPVYEFPETAEEQAAYDGRLDAEAGFEPDPDRNGDDRDVYLAAYEENRR